MSEPTTQPVAPDQLPPAAPGPIRVAGRRLLRRAVDAGLIGHRLQSHLVICGFPRSGSTLLQLMIDGCVTGVDSFRTEVEGLWAAAEAPRRRRWLVTKLPSDVERVPQLRRWYDGHPGSLRVLLTVRDPRSVLTSQHAGYPPSRGYYVSPERWRRVDALVRELRDDPDVSLIDYADLVGRPSVVQQRLTAELGWSVHTPFDRFTERVRPEALDRMTTGALGGVRPLDPTATRSWRAARHRERLRQLVAELPELPDRLVELGYATDRSWLDELGAELDDELDGGPGGARSASRERRVER